MVTKSDLPDALRKFPRLPVEDLGNDVLAKNGFKSLPKGVEGVYLVTAKHPFSEFLYRVEEVADSMRSAHQAELVALGYEVLDAKPVAVRPQQAVRFPYSVMADYPDSVNDLLGVARSIDSEITVAASKPGRVEDNLYGLLPIIKKVDKALEAPFYDRLIDFYLDVGNANYANRQAKQCISAMGKNIDTDWLVQRVQQLLNRGFYSSLLVESALEAVEKTQGAEPALDLHLSVLGGILKNEIKPNKGTLKALKKRAKALKALDRVDALLLEHLKGFLIRAEAHKELDDIRKDAITAMDKLPDAERMAFLQELWKLATGDDDVIAIRYRLWPILTERLSDLPDLADTVAQLAFRICQNFNFDYSNYKLGIEKSFRIQVGQYLQQLPPEVISRNLDAWAERLDDYSDWAREWFFDTFITMEEMTEKHPTLFEHEGIIRACIKGLCLGVVNAKNEEEFLDRLLQFLDMTKAKAARAEDFVRLAEDLLEDGNPQRVNPVFKKLATWAPELLQEVVVTLAKNTETQGVHAVHMWKILQECASWMTQGTRDEIRKSLGKVDVWNVFIKEAIDGGFTISPQDTWMDISPIKRSTWREDVMGILEHGGKRYLAIGKGDYEGHLNLFVDGELTYEYSNVRRSGETMQTANLIVQDGEVFAQILLGDDDETWRVKTVKMDGAEVGVAQIGDFKRVFFARHQPWVVGLSKDRCVVFDYNGHPLAEHEVTLRHTGDWDDFYGVVHPLKEHLLIKGPAMALAFGSDPAAPHRLKEEIAGGLERPDGLAFLILRGSEAEIIEPNGRVIEKMGQHPHGSLCGQCEEIHHASWKPTNIRGVPGEMLKGAGKNRARLVTHRREDRGWVDLSNAQEKYRVEWSVRDLDGDGYDEVYLFDFAGKKLTVQRDPAAPLREQLIAHREALLKPLGESLTLTQGVDPKAIRNHIEASIGSHGQDAKHLTEKVFEPIYSVVDQVRDAAETFYKALDTVKEDYPEQVVVKRVNLPRSEIDRLRKKYMSDRYCFKKYDFPKAMTEGNASVYAECWERPDLEVGKGHPNQPYLRTVIGYHMEMARETKLKPILRERILDLVDQMLDIAEHPDTWLTVSAKERGDGYFTIKESVTEDCVVNNHVNEGMRKQMAKYEKKWKLGDFDWSTAPSDSIYDLELRGNKQIGNAYLQVAFGVDQGDDMVHQDEPVISGPVAAVLENLDAMNAVAYWKESHEREPKRAWPGAPNSWDYLDEWMIPEEIASLRAEVARLREIPASETTAGPSAHSGLFALMAETWGFKEDTAKVLGALLMQPKYDRDRVSQWSGIESKKLLPHFKKLIAAKLIKKIGTNEYIFTTPEIAARWRHDEPTTAFKRLFFTIATMEGQRANGRTRVALRFSESDVIRHYLIHVGKVAVADIDAAIAGDANAVEVAEEPKKAAPKAAKKAAKKATKKTAKKAAKKATKKTAKKAAKKATKKSGKKGLRRFELSDGSSNKFWQVSVSGKEHTVTYGRIGTDGQTKTKSFASAEAAQADADKLIRQKEKKGYSEC